MAWHWHKLFYPVGHPMHFLLVLISYYVEPAKNENLIIYGNKRDACESSLLLLLPILRCKRRK